MKTIVECIVRVHLKIYMLLSNKPICGKNDFWRLFVAQYSTDGRSDLPLGGQRELSMWDWSS